MEIAGDHVHIFASIPPRYSVGEMVRVVSAKEIFRRHPRVKKELWGGRFLGRRIFCQDGRDKVTSETIKKYIEYHRHEEKTPNN